MNDKVKFAVIGCGRVAANHAENIVNLPGAELVAVCDLKEDRAKGFGEKYKVPYYLNYNEMLTTHDVDVINIVTPSGMHPIHAIDLIRKYKKHLVIEKPMFLNLEDCERLKQVAKENNVKIFPILQNRYNKAVQKVRKALDEGKFGKLVMGVVRLMWCRPQRYYDRDPWRGTWALDGGALTNQAIHHLDLLRWFLGEVVSVSAVGATQLVKVEVEDTAVVNLKFKNGALGSVIATTAIRPDDLEASLAIFGEKGRALISGTAVNKLTDWTLTDEDLSEYQVEFPNVYGFGHYDLLEDVVKNLTQNKPHPITYNEAAETLKLLNAIYLAIETGKTVYLKDQPASKKLGEKRQDLIDLYLTKEA